MDNCAPRTGDCLVEAPRLRSEAESAVGATTPFSFGEDVGVMRLSFSTRRLLLDVDDRELGGFDEDVPSDLLSVSALVAMVGTLDAVAGRLNRMLVGAEEEEIDAEMSFQRWLD